MPGSRSSPQLVILIGLPGSGKSTLAQRLLTERRRIIATDRIRATLFGDESVQGPWELIWTEVQRQFQQAVEDSLAGKLDATIFDATNAVRRNRREVIHLARQQGFTRLVALWLDVPLEVCLERNRLRDRQVPEAVIERMYRRLIGAPPSLSEGFDCLIRCPNH